MACTTIGVATTIGVVTTLVHVSLRLSIIHRRQVAIREGFLAREGRRAPAVQAAHQRAEPARLPLRGHHHRPDRAILTRGVVPSTESKIPINCRRWSSVNARV